MILCAVSSILTIRPNPYLWEMNDMLSIAVDLCKFIIEKLTEENELRFEEKLRISLILEEISNILNDTSNKMLSDEYPSQNCLILEKLSDRLHFHLMDYISIQECDNLHSLLKESLQVEKQFAQRHETDIISKIQNASAEFKVISMMLKI